MTTQTPLSIGLAVFASNLAYVFLIVILNIVFSVTPIEFLTGDFSGFMNQFVSLLKGIGAILTVIDIVGVAKFISSISNDGF